MSFRRGFEAEFRSIGALIAYNCAAPLDFDNRKNAHEVLSEVFQALSVRPHIRLLSASVYDADGAPFAEISTEHHPAPPKTEADFGTLSYHGDAVELSLPIPMKENQTGKLRLRAEYNEKLKELLSLLGLILTAVLVGSLVVILIVSSAMQGIITEPIADLARAARNVSEKEDYQTRAPEAGRDEVGLLTRAFNQMLDQIQSRDRRLSESQQRFEVAVQGSSDGIWDRDLITGAVYFSPRLKSMLGCQDSDLPSELAALQQRIHPDDQAEFQSRVDEYLAGNEPSFEVEFRARHADGTYRWILSRGAALRNEVGRPVRFAGSHTDITDRKRSDQEVRLAREKFESLVNSLHGVVWESEPDSFRILFCSDQAVTLLGYPVARWIEEGDFWEQHVHPEDLANARIARKNGLQAGRPFQLEYRMLAADGRSLWMRESVSVATEQGRATRLRSVSLDITEEKQAAEKITRMQRELVEVSRMAGMAEVATGVLHNVGNVLNSVNVSAALLRERLKDSRLPNLGRALALLREHEADLGTYLARDPKGHQVLPFLTLLDDHLQKENQNLLAETDSLDRNIQHIKQIVAAQQSHARVYGTKESVEAKDLIEDALRANLEGFQEFGIRVIRQFSPTPPLAVDRHKVLQILINLLRNAKQSLIGTDRPDRELRVTVAANGEDRIELGVTDNGGGIAPENLVKVFRHGFTTKKDGHGFGLHSCANAAKEMSGSLRAESAGIGQGATFTLELPVYRHPQPAAKSPPAKATT